MASIVARKKSHTLRTVAALCMNDISISFLVMKTKINFFLCLGQRWFLIKIKSDIGNTNSLFLKNYLTVFSETQTESGKFVNWYI
jgi:hypothetical protein